MNSTNYRSAVRRNATLRHISFAAVIALALAGCGDKTPPQPNAATAAMPATTATEKVKLRLAWVADMAEVGVFVAKEQGYFEREGLDVTIEPGGFGLDPFKLVATGGNEYGVGGAGNLLLARSNGIPVVAIAAEFQNTPVGFVTKADSGITSFAQFGGKKVGIQTGADTDVLYRALLVKNKMKSADVKEVPIQFDMTPFLSGAIDVLPGYVTNQPVTLKGKGVDTNVITAASQGLSYYGNVFFTTEQRLQNNPKQVEHLVRALRAGWKHAIDNKADAITALQKYTKDFDPKDLDAIYDRVVPFIKGEDPAVPLLGFSGDKWKTTHSVLKDAMLLKADVDLNKAYTDVFLK